VSNWRELTQAYRALHAAGAGTEDAEAAWTTYRELVQASSSHPPYHIKLLLDHLDAFRGDRRREDIVILDHGCGGALTLFYIAVLGYTNFWGVDIGGDFSSWNALARSKFGHKEDRLSVYEGQDLPLPDATVDVIFSQQVIEHLNDHALDSYYQEEGRVLKRGGHVVHYVPHRLVPYDSHTKTWLIHYLPQPLYRSAARLLRSPVPDHLHLRWPWVHNSLLRKYVGEVEDVTAARLATLPDDDGYDGSFGLRRAICSVMNTPVLKVIAGAILSNLVMLETISTKR